MNIVNGHIDGSNVNVQHATELGTDMLRSFYNDMPSVFYDSIRKRVTTIETANKGVKVGDGTMFDMKKLYGRMLVVSQQRHIDIRRVFSFELAPHPLSLFDEYGDMRKGTKATTCKQAGCRPTGVFSWAARSLHCRWQRHGVPNHLAKVWYGTDVREQFPTGSQNSPPSYCRFRSLSREFEQIT